MSAWNALWGLMMRAAKVQICVGKNRKRERERERVRWRGRGRGGEENKNTADWLALPRDAKVHQAVKYRKSKQAFNETKAPPPSSRGCQTGCTARAREQGARPGGERVRGGANEQAKREHKESIN